VSAIVESFQRITRDRPDCPLVFLAGTGQALTAADLWRAHEIEMGRLRQAGLGAGDLLVSATGNRPDLIARTVACRALGIALMAVDAGATRSEIDALAARFGAAAAMVPRETTARRRGTPEDFELVAGPGERHDYRGAAMLKLTSGSTGLPRATFTTESQLVADSRQIARAMGFGPTDTQLAAIPLSHAYGFSVLVVPLLLQGTPFVLRESFVPQQLTADARAFDVRRFPGVPFMFEHLLQHPPEEPWPAGLQRLVSAGAPLDAAVARAFHERFGVKVHAFYGTTEGGGITYDDSDDPAIADTVGRPIDGVTVSLRPEADVPGGRVHIRSAAVSAGYVGADQGDFQDDGFLAGDYGTVDANGRLTLSGRVSSFINVAGRKVQPAEVEAVLREMPTVIDVRVTGARDDRRGEHVVACLVRRPGSAPLTTIAVRQFCASRLASHKIPRAVVFVDAIPLTPRGKTDRAALDALIRSHTTDGQ